MQKKYCLPIIKSRKDDILEAIDSNKTDYSYFEVWLDYIDDLDEMFIERLKNLLKDKLILLFRRQNLEEVIMGLKKRLQIVSLLENSESFIDLDIFDQRKELEHIKNNQMAVKTIISYHNYQETPSDERLDEIISKISKHHPMIYKISTMCETEKDGVRLLYLLLGLKGRSMKYIILGMGEPGIITRIFGTLWGNEMIFAPKNIVSQSAPGQLTRSDFEEIFKVLRK